MIALQHIQARNLSRSVLLLCLCILPLVGINAKKPKNKGQVKKVAILETVDKTEKVDYVNKLMLRTNLTKAITQAEGYEGYDRTDLESLLGEQNFQRTGMVSADQIKQLGEMTGAQYVLVAEAAMADESTIFASAKIIDVETGLTIKTESQLMRATPKDIQLGCTELASNLLGVKLEAGITRSAATTTPPPAPRTVTSAPATTVVPTPAPAPAPQQPAYPPTPKQEAAPSLSSLPQETPLGSIQVAANNGDAEACYKVAQAYMNGDGVGKNLNYAFRYMKFAAEKGYAPAYIEVGKMYHGGRGVTKDRAVAEKWYKKAVNAGSAEAKRILLNM